MASKKLTSLADFKADTFWFALDAHERKVCIVSKDDNDQQERYFLLEDFSAEDTKRFGKELVWEEIDEDSDEFVNCDFCEKCFTYSCLEHPLYHCGDRSDKGFEGTDDRAMKTLPAFLFISNSLIPNAGKGVFTKVDVPTGIVFGPYEGILRNNSKIADSDGYSWELRRGTGKTSYYIDGHDPKYSNWMRYINSSRFEAEQNIIAFQYYGCVYYRVFKPIERETELLVWYGNSYALGNLASNSSGANTTSPAKDHRKRPKVLSRNPYIL